MNNQNPPKKPRCFPHHHLPPKEDSIRSVLWAIADKESHEIEIDARTLANQYPRGMYGTSKDSANRAIRFLIDEGWAEWVRQPKRNSKGQITRGRMRILSHSEYAKKHPGTCQTCLTNDTGSLSQHCPPACLTNETLEEKVLEESFIHSFNNRSLKDSSTATKESVSPVSLMIQANVSENLYRNGGEQPMDQTQATVPALLSGLPAWVPAVQKLKGLIEQRWGIEQNVEGIEHKKHLAKLTPEQAETLFNWVMNNPDPFWRNWLSGKNALRRFCHNILTITQQYNQALKAKTQSKSKSNLAASKAASVVPNPEKPFPYAGEVL